MPEVKPVPELKLEIDSKETNSSNQSSCEGSSMIATEMPAAASDVNVLRHSYSPASEPVGGELHKHVLTIETVPPLDDDERFELYKQYQMQVHDESIEEITKGGYERFLVNSPLYDPSPVEQASTRQIVRVLPQGNSVVFAPCDTEGQQLTGHHEPALICGTYHQLYRLDGALIAVGVIDITPSVISSVYCFYDPGLTHLSLGKFCALAEISWCLRARAFLPQMKYYYMGYYIHSCTKMRYKGEYKPSELLCPSTFDWYPLEDCIPLLEQYR
jgi:arginine-tRNA-protein transferase